MALKPGDLFAVFRIVRVLGEGAQACVYEALTQEGARRALKVVASAAGLASRDAARGAQESEALASLDHINILGFYGSGVEGDCVWLLLELIDGETLRDKLDRGPVPVEDLLRWAIQACEGIAAAHDAGIVHRDLKPENLLITGAGVVKVIDFGFAKLEHLGIQTTAGALIGTPLYMPPEQLFKAPPHPSWDVFAMGIILYEALSGAHPTEAPSRNPVDMFNRHVALCPKPLAQVAPGLSGRLTALVDQALLANPWQRPTIRALAGGLREELQLLLAPRRAAARNLPIPNRPAAAAPTVPLPACAEPPAPTPHAPAATVPLAVWREERAPGDRAAAPPPPSTAPVASARPHAPAATVTLAPAPPAVAERPSAGGGHDVSAAPVEAAARTPHGKRGRAAAAVLVALLAAAVAGAWAWYTLTLDGGSRATATAAAPAPPAPPASAAPAASALPARPGAPPVGSGTQPPARRGKGRGP